MGSGSGWVQPPSSPRSRRSRTAAVLIAGGLLGTACSDVADDERTLTPVIGADADGRTGSEGERALPSRLDLVVPDPNSVYDPIRGDETPPSGYRQLLPRDAIEPVYDPVFTTADGVDWPEQSLVIGVDLAGEARAYPVGFLNRREIVNDDHRGIPTLVTW